jgi:hypothetical protein
MSPLESLQNNLAASEPFNNALDAMSLKLYQISRVYDYIIIKLK